MQMYGITTYEDDGRSKERTFKEFGEIAHELRRLQEEKGYIVIVEVSPPVSGACYMQAVNDSYSEGIFKKREIGSFTIELNTIDVNDLPKQYAYHTSDFEEIEKIFMEFVSFQKLPPFLEWDDISEIYAVY